MKDRIKIHINRAVWADEYHVRMGARINESSPWAIAEPVKWRVLAENEVGYEPNPCLSMSRDDCQRFMDELWAVGIRPSEGEGSAGQAAATKAHLEDMRRLVFTESEARSKP